MRNFVLFHQRHFFLSYLTLSVSFTRCVNVWLCLVLVETKEDDAEAVADGKLPTGQKPETAAGASGTLY